MNLLYVCVGAISNLLLLAISNGNWVKTDRRFAIKKLIDCIVPVWMYSYLVFGHYVSSHAESQVGFWSVIVVAVIIVAMYIAFFFSEVKFFSKINSKYIRGTWFIYILLSLFFVLLLAGTMLNYISYMIWPSLYEIPTGLNHAAVGFEFLYYTFSLMITYSGSSINAVHVASKTMQMCEIAASYILFGIFFVDLLVKVKAAFGLSKE